MCRDGSIAARSGHTGPGGPVGGRYEEVDGRHSKPFEGVELPRVSWGVSPYHHITCELAVSWLRRGMPSTAGSSTGPRVFFMGRGVHRRIRARELTRAYTNKHTGLSVICY